MVFRVSANAVVDNVILEIFYPLVLHVSMQSSILLHPVIL
jgi:hypothetical protein